MNTSNQFIWTNFYQEFAQRLVAYNEQIQPDNLYQFHGNQISVRTLDLNLPFKEIEEQLDLITFSHFGELTKL